MDKNKYMEKPFRRWVMFGKDVLFSFGRIRRECLPAPIHCYELQGSDQDPGAPAYLVPYCNRAFCGTVLSKELFGDLPAAITGHIRDTGRTATIREYINDMDGQNEVRE